MHTIAVQDMGSKTLVRYISNELRCRETFSLNADENLSHFMACLHFPHHQTSLIYFINNKLFNQPSTQLREMVILL